METDGKKPSIEVQEVTWDALRPHYLRSALFWVSPSVDLEEVAKAVAVDDSSRVANWLQERKIRRVEAAMAAQWEATPDAIYRFVILQPYVFVQAKALLS